MWTDTHVHFDGIGDEAAVEAAVARAVESGVSRMLAVGGSGEANRRALRMAEQFPVQIRAALGHDREQVREACATPDAIAAACAELRVLIAGSPSVAAVGETGLDYHYSADTAEAQAQLFERQLVLARDLALPVIVHSREAEEATLNALTAHGKQWQGEPEALGVLHCFAGDAGFARAVVALGFHVSFSGIATFKNAAAVREADRAVPDERLLIETDTPYLAPVPHRGKPNEPAYARLVGEALAELRGTSPETLAELTTRNAARLFGFGEGQGE